MSRHGAKSVSPTFFWQNIFKIKGLQLGTAGDRLGPIGASWYQGVQLVQLEVRYSVRPRNKRPAAMLMRSCTQRFHLLGWGTPGIESPDQVFEDLMVLQHAQATAVVQSLRLNLKDPSLPVEFLTTWPAERYFLTIFLSHWQSDLQHISVLECHKVLHTKPGLIFLFV